MTIYPRITVIGAGIIGCAVAYELGRRGAAVTVLERRDVALGATQASAGMLAPFIEAHHGGPLRALGVRSLELYDRAIRSLRSWAEEQRYNHARHAFNYRMDGIQGAILRVKLQHLPTWTEA